VSEPFSSNREPCILESFPLKVFNSRPIRGPRYTKGSSVCPHSFTLSERPRLFQNSGFFRFLRGIQCVQSVLQHIPLDELSFSTVKFGNVHITQDERGSEVASCLFRSGSTTGEYWSDRLAKTKLGKFFKRSCLDFGISAKGLQFCISAETRSTAASPAVDWWSRSSRVLDCTQPRGPGPGGCALVCLAMRAVFGASPTPMDQSDIGCLCSLHSLLGDLFKTFSCRNLLTPGTFSSVLHNPFLLWGICN
jgi:hypothetical protein